ncbi:MAG: chorismate mutase [Frankiales bacterium]|nr:chorismate mutase [Frankiales bacterium]
MAVRAVRGAIQIDADDRQQILDATTELLTAVLETNAFTADDLISVVFTATPDLKAEFPAYAARQMGIVDVPLLCAGEIDVPGAMPRVLRLLAHVETDRTRAQVRHVYLRGAAALRTDLPR